MKYESYYTRCTNTSLTYEFYREGPVGNIAKRVLYTPFDENGHVYNLSFGNIDSDDELDDLDVTNNGDTEKILFTVGSTVHGFFELYPGKKILITGSTDSRTRLYRMMISRNAHEWIDKFEILGLIDLEFLPFDKNKKYDAFLISKKS